MATGVQWQNLGFEILDVLGSVEDTWWRVFLGGGLVVLDNSAANLTAKPAFIQWGIELRGPVWEPWDWLKNTRLRPVLGGNFSTVQAIGWTPNASGSRGLEVASPGEEHRAQALVESQRTPV